MIDTETGNLLNEVERIYDNQMNNLKQIMVDTRQHSADSYQELREQLDKQLTTIKNLRDNNSQLEDKINKLELQAQA